MSSIGRREFLAGGAASVASAPLLGSSALADTAATSVTEAISYPYQDGRSPWPLVLNASTVRHVGTEEKIRVAEVAGWDGIELWIDDLEGYEEGGGDLKELGAEILDRGLYVPNIIGLWNGMPETPEAFEESLEATRRRMRQVSEVGSPFVAAIPLPDRPNFDFEWGIEMYRELLRIGREDYGITVAFEFVGFLQGVHRLGQATAIALDVDDAEACLIMDTFHLFRGGSGFNGIKHLQGNFFADFHWNDVPGDMPREDMGDGDRILPGDGVLPLVQVLKDLHAIGYKRCLSLELFSQALWERDAEEVSQLGIEKMRANLDAAGFWKS